MISIIKKSARVIAALVTAGGFYMAGFTHAHAEERVSMPRFPANWIEAFSRTGDQELVEYVPPGQNASAWSEKISLEIYHNLNNLPLDALQRRAVAQVRESCDGVVEGKFQSGINNGYASAFWTLGCKKHLKTGLGEAHYTKVVQGNRKLYVLSRMWRTPAFGDEGPNIPQQAVEEAIAFLTSSVVCDTELPEKACPQTSKP